MMTLIAVMKRAFENAVSAHQAGGIDFFNLIPAPWGEGPVLPESEAVIPLSYEIEICRSKGRGSTGV
jgi:hypothetical protein